MRALLLLLLPLLTSCTTGIDSFAVYNFSYTSSIYDIEPEYSNLTSNFAKGDAILIESRMNGVEPLDAIGYYELALKDTDNLEEKAILYETLGSLTGKGKYYKKSFALWKILGNEFRADMGLYLARGQNPPYNYEEFEIEENYIATPKNSVEFSIGESYFFIEGDDILVSQVDRVTRDWLSSQLQEPNSEKLLTIFSEGYDFENIGWHEGGRISQYLDIANFTHKSATGTIVRKIDDKWYAPNEFGVFMFEVPIDKVQYPTTRFLREDLALIIDTHGVNMLVEQAIRENASVVVGCCDHPGKIKAAMYLNKKDIKVICNTDKHLPLALGQTDDTLGSVPFRSSGDKVQVGYQPILINITEKIIVLNSTGDFGLTYYSTPTYYFNQLKKKTTLDLDLDFVYVDDYGELDLVVDRAKDLNASVIAARSYTEKDYLVLSSWLEESKENRLILFHSEPYPYGFKLYREYSSQVTFDDIMPKFY